MDSFIDFDNFNSPSLSPNPSSKGKQAISSHPSIGSSGNSFASSQSSQQIFSGPSHQYDSYKQQTGLPVGGLANTLAVNQATNMHFNGTQTGFVAPQETYFPMPSTEDMFDFGRNPSLSEASDMDFDTESPVETLPAYFYPNSASSASSNSQFVNPSAITGQGQQSNSTSTQQVQRMYPGMHSQQAAMAKAQQQQRQEVARQQQQRQQEAQRQAARPSKVASHTPTDPIVEERISRLLHQMRQSSVGSQDDDAATPTGNQTHIARLKKEEDEMDEDERLLASEEGKKLSSKERRQLRNKVSARAFRSRRKGKTIPACIVLQFTDSILEYIGQLEGEVAAKVQEANDLRVQNRELMEENQRLTDLTRMLLSSPSFSGFLNDLSVNGMAPPPNVSASERQASQPAPTQRSARKDVNPNQVAQDFQHQSSAQIGMALIPEPVMDFSMLDAANTGNWNTGIDMSFPQVYAVTEVPSEPVVDTGMLSGKTSNFVELRSTSDDSKECPIIQRMSGPETDQAAPTASDPEVELDESDPAFALFVDALPLQALEVAETSEGLFGGVRLEKVFERFELVVDDGSEDVLASAKLAQLSSSIDDAFQRIGNLTSHL